MKIIATCLFLLNLIQPTFCQTFAKTTDGKTVILNSNGTWKYADKESANSEQTDCAQTHTGTLTVVNNNKSDIYFFYAHDAYTLNDIKMIKIKAGATKLIRDILAYGLGRYDWKATLEASDGQTDLAHLKGIANGTFNIVECKNKEVEIDE